MIELKRPTKEELFNAYEEWLGKDSKLGKRWAKKSSVAVVLSDGRICDITNENIEKEFLVGYSSLYPGCSYKRACKEKEYIDGNADYFMEVNGNKSAEWLKSLKDSSVIYLAAPFIRPSRFVNVYHDKDKSDGQVPADAVIASEEDRDAIIAAAEEHHKKHIKRLEKYLKRYGTSEIKAKLYWIDR